MSPFVAYHATRKGCRDSIRRRGLLPNQPWTDRPYGVYVFSNDIRHHTHRMVRGGTIVEWSAAPRQDVWRVAYIGPFTNDDFVFNGVVLLEPVPPSEITLVTGH